MLRVARKALLLARAQMGLNPDDVFQSRLRTGTSAARTEAIGWRPDLVWIKRRDLTGSHFLFDTDRGTLFELNTDNEEHSISLANSLTAFNADGYSLGSSAVVNTSGGLFVDWLFKETPGFFKKGIFTKPTTAAVTIDLSSLGTVGAVIVKDINNTSDWWFWHRSLTVGRNLRLSTTAAEDTTNAFVSVSGTTATFARPSTSTYEYYAFAHQPGGIIQCGAFDSINGTISVDLGWDLQWLMTKVFNITGNWFVRDLARGFTTSSAGILSPNTGDSETSSTSNRLISNGFSFTGTNVNRYAYIAIKKGSL